MSWDTSDRRERLPADWFGPGGRRDRVLSAPHGRRCKLRFEGCTKFATQVDHIVPGDNHGEDNLQSVCKHCHQIKSAREGVAARPRQTRRVEQHPAFKSMGVDGG